MEPCRGQRTRNLHRRLTDLLALILPHLLGFVVSNLLTGSGLSVLEVAANPFIALARPDELMESRLNFAQGMQAVGVVVSPLIAVEVMFKNGGRAGLFNSQLVYLAAALRPPCGRASLASCSITSRSARPVTRTWRMQQYVVDRDCG